MIIQSKNVWFNGFFSPLQVEMEDGKIKDIYAYGQKAVDHDYGENYVMPGFIDVHCHGGIGYDTNDADPVLLKKWARVLLNEGITSFCPTTITQTEEVLTKALKSVVEAKKTEEFGAEIVGIHFEGPYLSIKYKGAQPESFIIKPNIEQFKKFQEAANGMIKIITMATENDEGFKLTEYCVANGVRVSQGHSCATYEKACEAVMHGASSFTHTYNGMTGLHHRDPGLVGAAMTTQDTYAEIICDGNHVVWPAIKALVKCKGKNHMIMIDDALMGKGLPIGEHFIFGGQEIEIRENGSAYLCQGSKSLAGSTLKFNEGLKNLVTNVGLDFETAINMVSTNPAKYLGIDDHKGYIKKGYDADITILDKDFQPVQVFKFGKNVYNM